MTTTTRPTPGRRVRHRYTCTRTAAICEGIKRDATGRAFVVHVCAECRGDDYDSVLIDTLLPDPPAAA